MTTHAIPHPRTHRLRAVPTGLERMLLRASQRLESLAMTRMERRSAAVNVITERARSEAADSRRTAQALGSQVTLH